MAAKKILPVKKKQMWNTRSFYVHVCDAQVGHEIVRVDANLMSGNGSVDGADERFGKACMSIGLDQGLPEVVETLLHEAIEFYLTRHDMRLQPAGCNNYCHDRYVFHFDHAQLSMLCHQVGWFVHEVMPKLLELHKKRKELVKECEARHKDFDTDKEPEEKRIKKLDRKKRKA